jgi:cation transport ATPase
MTQTLSRSILGVETVVLTVPVTLMMAFGLLTAVAALANVLDDPGGFVYFALMLLSLLALIAVWVLSVSFMFRGSESLQRRSKAWWYLMLAGAAMAIIGGAACLAPDEASKAVSRQFYDYVSLMRLFVLGLPLLIPLGHLAKERSK